jgi:hypothetical protein
MFGLALAVLVTCAAPRPAGAQLSITISVDENGNGKLQNSTGFHSTLAASQMQDPGPGGLANALTYDLGNPPGLTAGDLLLRERARHEVISDIIRFNPNEVGPGGGTGTLVFYSDLDGGVDSLADIGGPTELYVNAIALYELGPEGDNGITYTPTFGQPGFVSDAGGPVTYQIISDSPVVPEPGSLSLLATGGLPLLGFLRRRRIAWRSLCSR